VTEIAVAPSVVASSAAVAESTEEFDTTDAPPDSAAVTTMPSTTTMPTAAPIRRHFGLKNKFKPNIVAATDRHRNIAAGDLPPPQR
jgi:hypothetical protein